MIINGQRITIDEAIARFDEPGIFESIWNQMPFIARKALDNIPEQYKRQTLLAYLIKTKQAMMEEGANT